MDTTITDITTRLIQIPFTEGLRTTYGERTACTILIVTVTTADGAVGYGESVGLFHETAASFIEHELRELLLGHDCRRTEYLIHRVEHLIEWSTWAAYPIAALDMALHDVKGKVLGLPVYELLGGRYRSEVAFSGLIHIHSVEEDAATAKSLVDRGFTHLKVKVGLDPTDDMRRLERIREVCGPEVRIRIDPNMAWTPRTAVRLIEAMARFDLEYVEQPVPGWDIDGMAEVARSVSVPLCADESCQSPRDALRLAERQACEVFLVYLSEAGGLIRAREIIAIAQTAGIQCALGTWGEGGVGFAAGLHLASASRGLSLVSDTAYGLLADDYIVEPFSLVEGNGLVGVPSDPGLGVQPDPSKLDRYSQILVADRVFQQATDAVPRLRQLVQLAGGR